MADWPSIGGTRMETCELAREPIKANERERGEIEPRRFL